MVLIGEPKLALSLYNILIRELSIYAQNGSSRIASISRRARILNYFLQTFETQKQNFDAHFHLEFYSKIFINLSSSMLEDIQYVYELLLTHYVTTSPEGHNFCLHL